jgi:hypothetical protein
MKNIIFSVLAFMAVAATNQPPVVQLPVEVPLKVRIAGTVLPKVHMDAATPEEAIQWLRKESKKYTPDKSEINFVWQVPAETKLRPVTLNLVKVPLADVLDYVTQAAGVRYRVERYAVVIYVPPPTKTEKSKTDVQSE